MSEARAHLAALVAAAEHEGHRTLILRHGKPVAAIVPVRPAASRNVRRPRRRGLPKQDIQALLAPLGRGRRKGAVADLVAGRR